MTTCNHPVGTVACVLEEGHAGKHAPASDMTEETWHVDGEFSPLPSGAVAVWVETMTTCITCGKGYHAADDGHPFVGAADDALAEAVKLLREAHKFPPHQTREQWIEAVGWDADRLRLEAGWPPIWREPNEWCPICKFLARIDALVNPTNDSNTEEA